MSVGKEKNLKNVLQDSVLEFLRSLPKESYKISYTENDTLSGDVVLSNATQTTIPTSAAGTKFSYLNFFSKCHYDAKKEININQNASDFFKTLTNIEYNFLIKQFEDYISQNTVPELNLPNFYDTINNELIKETPFDSVAFFEQNLSRLSDPLNTSNKKNFYNSTFSTDEQNLLKTKKFTEYLKKYNPFKEQFPYYTEIYIDNSEIPKNISFDYNLDFGSRGASGTTKSVKTFNDIFEKYSLHKGLFDYYDKKKDESVRLNQTAVADDNTIKTQQISVSSVNMYDYFNEIITVKPQIREELETIAATHEITYEKILKETPCYVEVVGYKISKYDTDNLQPFQEFYLPNSREDKTEFIDTQIKYGKKYRYKVSLLSAIIFADYTYTNTSNKEVKFELTPKVFLFEIDSSEYGNYLFDSPPIEPEVEILPFVGVSNKVKFNLNTAVGRKYSIPITFSDDEKRKINKISQAQDRTDSYIKFESEESSDYFEIYRLEKEPKLFTDFIGSKKIIVDNNNSSAGSYVDELVHNKKYYYTFRSVDYHENISNPSVIYVVELVNDGGVVFPLIGVHEIKADPLKMETKKFRRYLSISPNLANTLLSLEKNDNFKGLNDAKTILDSAKIGLNQSGVWNKKFKIRINSISSGRKIDINLTFKIDKKS